MEEKLLEGIFEMLPSCRRYSVILTRQNLIIREHFEEQRRRSTKMLSVLVENVIGCKILESKIRSDPCYCFQIIGLIKNKKGIRERKLFVFRVFSTNDKQESYVIAETWARTVSWLVRDPKSTAQELEEKESFPTRLKYFVFLNPKSGSGKTLSTFKDTFEPLLKDSNIDYKVLTTEYAGQCTKTAVTLDYTNYDAVIILSGDGMVYEYINGIMSRDDWIKAIRLPIGILPTGSGNALAASALYKAKEAISISNAAYIILKGKSSPMDLFCMHSPTKVYYGFLSFTWGLMSDVDIESEKFRKLGSIRFTIGALQRILGLRIYRASFSYLPAKSSNNEAVSKSETYNHSNGTDLNQLDSENLRNINGAGCEINKLGDLPPLSDSVPDNWVQIDGEFVTIGLTSLSHLGTDMFASPTSKFNDGKFVALVIRKGVTKKRMIDIMTAFENGTHVNFPEVEVIEMETFRFVPHPDSRIGHVVIDGEEIEYSPVQAQILPSLANVLLLPDAN